MTHGQELRLERIEATRGFSEISLGKVEIVSRFSYIIHKIQPVKIAETLEYFRNKTDDIADMHYKGLLKAEISEAEGILHTLLPRRAKRGLMDAGGRLLNWAFGTLDDNDKKEIDNHFASVEESNQDLVRALNEQIEINSSFNQSFQQLEQLIKSDRQLLIKELEVTPEIQQELRDESRAIVSLFTIGSFKRQLKAIQDSVAAAKAGLFDPSILSRNETEKYNIDLAKLKEIRLGTATYQGNTLVLVIKIPSQTVQAWLKMIAPVPNPEGYRANLEMERIVMLGGKEYEYVEGKSVFELRESSNCVLKGKCRLIRDAQEKTLEVESNMLLLTNMRNRTVNSTCDQRTLVLQGHYLLTFNNCSVKIGKEVFVNSVEETEQRFVLSTDQREVVIEKSISFDELVLHNRENLRKLKELHLHRVVITTTTSLSATAIIVLGIGLAVLCRRQGRSRERGMGLRSRRSVKLRSLIRRYPPPDSPQPDKPSTSKARSGTRNRPDANPNPERKVNIVQPIPEPPEMPSSTRR